MTDTASVKKTDAPRIIAGRSPAYPYLPLEKAVERAEQVRDANASRAVMTAETFYKIWGLGAQSSGARQTLAALNHFGLVEYIGRGEDRKVKLTDVALKIILDKRIDSPDRAAALRQAALEPPIHRELFEKYGWLLPDKVVVESYLTIDRGYNQQAASNLVDEYKDTLAFAGLDKPGSMPSEANVAADNLPPAIAKVGDLVQWTSGGVDQFPAPKRVLGFQMHEGKEWAFVEGENVGMPMAELSVVTAAAAGTPLPPTAPPEFQNRAAAKPGTRQEVFALDEGDVILSFPEGMSLESYNDLESYLNLFLRKAKRRAGKKDTEGAE